ncbi:phage tail protein [Parasegetibacter sp. NRK P23]|uniref:phage tail protein n=1 Tax=Parasegetibacter sp. NRK P23 TaxID=2942999 RepID=UPI002044B788|nr:phage tail protein [Parasegetibacter sp. NRK P23]MCM5528975.1 phage tail protein [Parasegetibacter sp. NRK P23]
MANEVLADSISHQPEFQGWYRTIKDTVADLDLGRLLVYIIDTVDSSAIPALAEQFNVLGYKGMKLAQNEQEQREIIKRSIELHRYKGTEWAIKEALKSIGFDDVQLIKTGFDHWAKFGLEITNSTRAISDNAFTDITQMVKEYKRAVCVLDSISLTISVEDVIDISEDEAIANPAIVLEDLIEMSGTLRYDGEGMYDGDYDHSGDSDVVIIEEA